MNTFELFELLFETVKKHGYFMTILDVKDGVIKMKVWNETRRKIVTLTREFVEDACTLYGNNFIAYLFEKNLSEG